MNIAEYHRIVDYGWRQGDSQTMSMSTLDIGIDIELAINVCLGLNKHLCYKCVFAMDATTGCKSICTSYSYSYRCH